MKKKKTKITKNSFTCLNAIITYVIRKKHVFLIFLLFPCLFLYGSDWNSAAILEDTMGNTVFGSQQFHV